MNGKIIKTMLINFLIWLVPVTLFLAVSVGVIAVVLMAAGDLGTSSSEKKDPFKKWPKGFIGSLGIGFFLVVLASLGSFFYFNNIDVQGVIFIVGLALICFLFGYWAVKYDYKRLKNKFSSNID